MCLSFQSQNIVDGKAILVQRIGIEFHRCHARRDVREVVEKLPQLETTNVISGSEEV